MGGPCNPIAFRIARMNKSVSAGMFIDQFLVSGYEPPISSTKSWQESHFRNATWWFLTKWGGYPQIVQYQSFVVISHPISHPFLGVPPISRNHHIYTHRASYSTWPKFLQNPWHPRIARVATDFSQKTAGTAPTFVAACCPGKPNTWYDCGSNLLVMMFLVHGWQTQPITVGKGHLRENLHQSVCWFLSVFLDCYYRPYR